MTQFLRRQRQLPLHSQWMAQPPLQPQLPLRAQWMMQPLLRPQALLPVRRL